LFKGKEKMENKFCSEEYKVDPSKILGTDNYLAPEVIKEEVITKEVDYWALGVLIYELFVNKLPFHASTLEAIHENILNLNINWSAFDDVKNDHAMDLIKKLLVINPADRWGSRNIIQIKEHSFFDNFDWKNVRNIRDATVMKHVKTRIADFNAKKPKACENINLTEYNSNDDLDFCQSVVKNLDQKNKDIVKSDLKQNKFIFASDEKLIDIMRDII
jgi:serine/threonine protein kinase